MILLVIKGKINIKIKIICVIYKYIRGEIKACIIFSNLLSFTKKIIFKEEARSCLSVCQNKEKDENNNIFSTKCNF